MIQRFSIKNYKEPEEFISKIVTSQSIPVYLLNKQRNRIAFLYIEEMPPLSFFSQSYIKLFGLSINPRNLTPKMDIYFSQIKILNIGMCCNMSSLS